jgi:hypothetical protein
VDAAEDEALHKVIDSLARKEEIALKMEQTTTMQVGWEGLGRAGRGWAWLGKGGWLLVGGEQAPSAARARVLRLP